MSGEQAAMLRRFAPAKINLSLRIVGRLPNGYHALDSVVVFASVGDWLSLAPDAQGGGDVSGAASRLRVTGPFAAALTQAVDCLDDASVLQAEAALAHRLGGRMFCYHLEKNLPVAAGIGGGTADAAAALHLINEVMGGLGGAISEVELREIGLGLGADVPVCLYGQACRMTGVGEVIAPLSLPEAMPTVLVNPGVAVSTGAIFRALDAAPLMRNAMGLERDAVELAGADRVWRDVADVETLVAVLAEHGNDLEPHAVRAAPEIASVLDALRGQTGVRVARMSGSGATCFALFDTDATAAAAACALAAAHPNWWVEACVLNP